MVRLRCDCLYFLDSLDGLNRDLRSSDILGGFLGGRSLKKIELNTVKGKKIRNDLNSLNFLLLLFLLGTLRCLRLLLSFEIKKLGQEARALGNLLLSFTFLNKENQSSCIR